MKSSEKTCFQPGRSPTGIEEPDGADAVVVGAVVVGAVVVGAVVVGAVVVVLVAEVLDVVFTVKDFAAPAEYQLLPTSRQGQ